MRTHSKIAPTSVAINFSHLSDFLIANVNHFFSQFMNRSTCVEQSAWQPILVQVQPRKRNEAASTDRTTVEEIRSKFPAYRGGWAKLCVISQPGSRTIRGRQNGVEFLAARSTQCTVFGSRTRSFNHCTQPQLTVHQSGSIYG